MNFIFLSQTIGFICSTHLRQLRYLSFFSGKALNRIHFSIFVSPFDSIWWMQGFSLADGLMIINLCQCVPRLWGSDDYVFFFCRLLCFRFYVLHYVSVVLDFHLVDNITVFSVHFIEKFVLCCCDWMVISTKTTRNLFSVPSF